MSDREAKVLAWWRKVADDQLHPLHSEADVIVKALARAEARAAAAEEALQTIRRIAQHRHTKLADVWRIAREALIASAGAQQEPPPPPEVTVRTAAAAACICYPGMCSQGCEPACPVCFAPLEDAQPGPPDVRGDKT